MIDREVEALATALDLFTINLSSISKEDVIWVLNLGEIFCALNCRFEPNSKARVIPNWFFVVLGGDFIAFRLIGALTVRIKSFLSLVGVIDLSLGNI